MRIYLDTSVISYLDQPESPEKFHRTHDLWKVFAANQFNQYDICISEIVLGELYKCREEKLDKLIVYLGKIEYTILREDDASRELAEGYIQENVLTRRHYLDLSHLAIASVNYCNVLLSWNFSHIVQHRTMTGVNITNRKFGYGELMLLSPFSFQWEDE